MALTLKEINPKSTGELKKFVKFPIDTLYKDNQYYVPALILDEVGTLHPDKNPAFEFCEAVYFMVYDDGKPVGRIAGIINKVVQSIYYDKPIHEIPRMANAEVRVLML